MSSVKCGKYVTKSTLPFSTKCIWRLYHVCMMWIFIGLLPLSSKCIQSIYHVCTMWFFICLFPFSTKCIWRLYHVCTMWFFIGLLPFSTKCIQRLYHVCTMWFSIGLLPFSTKCIWSIYHVCTMWFFIGLLPFSTRCVWRLYEIYTKWNVFDSDTKVIQSLYNFSDCPDLRVALCTEGYFEKFAENVLSDEKYRKTLKLTQAVTAKPSTVLSKGKASTSPVKEVKTIGRGRAKEPKISKFSV